MKVTLPGRQGARARRRRHRRRCSGFDRTGLAKAALAVKVDGDDAGPARRCPTARCSRSSPTARRDALELIRHDTAHVLAAAVMELYPGVKISIGPPIENGFYYDFDFPEGARSPTRTSSASRRR